MEATENKAAVAARELSGIRERVRARRRAVSVPLLVTGSAITAVTIRDLVFWSIMDNGDPGGPAAHELQLWPVRLVFWLLVPASFLGVWWLRRHTRFEQGVGLTRPSGVTAGLVTALVVVPAYFFAVIVFGGSFLAFSVGLLILGLAERTTGVWAWALGVGTLGTIEVFHGFSNRLPPNLWFDEAHDLILVVLALLTLVAGAVAWHRENGVLEAASSPRPAGPVVPGRRASGTLPMARLPKEVT